MREQANLSRRSLAAIPLAALIRPAAAARVAPGPAEADAELLELGRRWQAALSAEIAHGRAYSAAMSDAEGHAHDAAGDDLHARATELLQLITRTPATTIAGLAVKGRLLAYEHDVDEPDEVSITEALREAHYLEDRVALSIALDAVRLARRAAT